MKYGFDKQVRHIIEQAKQEAKDMGNNYIGSEHLLLALLKENNSPLSKALILQGIYYYQLKEDLMVLFGLKDQNVEEILVTQVVDRIFQRAQELASKSDSKQINEEMLTCSLLETKSCVASEILHRYDVDGEMVLSQLQKGTLHEIDKVNELRNLNVCTHHAEIVGREKELNLMISILSRKNKANPLLIGDPGVGKTALVEKLANMIHEKAIPSLMNSCIYELHLNSLVAGTKYRGDFEEKLQNIIQLLQKYPNVILFIDEIHQMIGAGKSEGSIDVSSVLKPYLARGEIKCIGATTLEEYEKYIEKDRALERRFQVISIKEPDKDETIEMLLSKRKEYEEFHQVKVNSDVLTKIVQYCDYYMPARKFPDKAIDVLDLACVEAKCKNRKEVDNELILDVMEKLTNIPLTKKDRLQLLKKQLEEHVFGHKEVIEKLMHQLTWIEQGVVSQRPLGVWLFAGNEGVGKKTLIYNFNRYYFHQEDIIEFDVTTFEKNFEHNIFKLRRNPYSIVYISHLHMANDTLLQFFKQAIEKGFLEHDVHKVDLRHCIIIMSGDFASSKTNIMHFENQNENRSFSSLKELDKDFLNLFDEVFMFQDLTIIDRQKALKTLLKDWKYTMEETAILEVVETSSTIKEAYKKLKGKIVNV